MAEMATYHLSMKIISRKNGYSAVASVIYRPDSVIPDDYTELTHDYTRKRGVDDTAVLTPANTSSWCDDRFALWNTVEKTEQRRNFQLAREIELAIPREIPREATRETVLVSVRENFISRGMITDVTFHHMDWTNPHAHIMLTMRAVGETEFAGKIRGWNDRAFAEMWRAPWADHANRAFTNAGHQEEIGHHSYKCQELEKAPGLRLGEAACAMEKRGMEIERGEQNRPTNSPNLEIQVSRMRLVLRTVQEARRKRESSDAACHAVGALNPAIPVMNASADILQGFIATLPQEYRDAWEMTPEFLAMSGKVNDIEREENALPKEQAISEKEIIGLRKAHLAVSPPSETPLMMWVGSKYRKGQPRFQKLGKQIESLRRICRAAKERDIPTRYQASEIQWNTWIVSGMVELREKLSVWETGWRKEEAEAETYRKEQKHEARLKRHDSYRLNRETALVEVITGLRRAREPGTGRIVRYIMLNNRVGGFTVWGDKLTHYPRNVHDPVDVYLSPGRAVMVSDIHERMPESHETVVRPERMRVYSDATIWHILGQAHQGWSSYGFPALSHHRPDSSYFSDGRRPVVSLLPSTQRADITADIVPEQLMPVVFSREGNSRTLNLSLCKGSEEMLVGFARREGGLYSILVLPPSDYSHLIVSIITKNEICLASCGEVTNHDEDIPYPSEPHLMRFRLKGHHNRLLAAAHKPEEVPDHLSRQLGFNQAWHEQRRDEQYRQQQRRPGHFWGVSM